MTDHGTTTRYRGGCRCADCKRSAYSYVTARRLRALDDPLDPKHGTSTGYGYGCRCDRCRAWAADYNKAYRAARPGLDKRKNLRKKYALSLEEYEGMLLAQGYVCAICFQPETRTRLGRVLDLAVDHDHATGSVRGLLCGACNVALGLLAEDVTRIESMADYVERFG